LDLIVESVANAGYKIGEEIYIALDTAAAELFNPNDATYHLEREGDNLTGKELIGLYASWVNRYPIISIEDGLSEDEWDDWQSMMSTIGSEVQLVGDDLLTTNPNRIERGIREKCANAVLIKPNQIGTLSETLDAIDLARNADWGTVMSHRSGETEDYIIADLAVGTAAGQIKTGAPARGERTAKYNRLIRIEEELGDLCTYAGKQVYEKYL
jgi:enolase